MPLPLNLGQKAWKSAGQLLRVPPGTGVLFGPKARRRLLLAVLGSLVMAGIEVASVTAVVPLMQLVTGTPPDEGAPGRVADLLGITNATTLAIVLAGTVLGGFLLKGLVGLAFRWWLLGVMMRQQVDTSREMLEYYLTGPYSLHKARHTGELLRNCTDAVGRAYGSVAMGGINVVTETVTVTAVIGLLVVVAPLPTIGLVLYFGIAAYAYARITQPRLVEYGRISHEAQVDVFGAAINALGGVKEIKLRSTYDFFLHRFTKARLDIARADRTTMFLNDLPKHVMEIMFIIGLGGLVATVFATNATDAALGVVAMFAAAGYRTLPSVVRLISTFGSMRNSDPVVVDVVRDVLAARESAATTEKPAHALPLQQKLTIENVSFTYPDGDNSVLNDVSMTLENGRSLALVGGSGAGKSTLVDLILGMHEPTQGTIRVDGVDITDDLPAWRAGIGLVPQEVWFTDGTLRENITFGVEANDVDQESLRAAVTQADLDEFVASLPDGLETSMGERGARLSGGQRQRIGIARALYAKPQLLVLDEATSALDNITERRVTDTIQRLSGSLSMIIVAHRLSTVRMCDQLVFLRHGRVAAVGTFDEVARADAEFARMVELGSLAPLESASS
ncbi:ABC transporter ATP-binding protein [Nocardioides glacieisoli]|uniref:ABC transporter ATP-binding protein n=1 Tax=Nocardioides glacieisoli TaxID=1168730 RepID=A0A4Q2RTM5_9ACTN|nr:ABC transporter ATP-binding protein [Nocardioides glacieisoli]RYB92367.1 ABC transporter ATP-binding protein [Nocardioides glacieisoli]